MDATIGGTSRASQCSEVANQAEASVLFLCQGRLNKTSGVRECGRIARDNMCKSRRDKTAWIVIGFVHDIRPRTSDDPPILNAKPRLLAKPAQTWPSSG